MADITNTQKIEETTEDELTFYDQGELITKNILTTITRMLVLILSVSYLISSNLIFVAIFAHQPLMFIFTIVLACLFIGTVSYEIIRDVKISRYTKLVGWDSVKFTPEGIVLDVPIEMEKKWFKPDQVTKMDLLTNVRWGFGDETTTMIMINVLLYLKNQPSQMIYCLYRDDGAPIPRSKLKQISKYISNHYDLPVKIRNIRDFSIIMIIGIAMITALSLLIGS